MSYNNVVIRLYKGTGHYKVAVHSPHDGFRYLGDTFAKIQDAYAWATEQGYTITNYSPDQAFYKEVLKIEE